MALLNLTLKNFKVGWKDYEMRKHKIIFNEYLRDKKLEIWDFNKKNDKVLFHQEQGLGDQLLFGSIFKDLFDYNNSISIEIDHRLLNIYRRTYPMINFIELKEQIISNDNLKHFSIGSLGKFFRNNLSDFMKNINLKADKNLITKYRKNLEFIKKTKVGISWAKFSKNDPTMKKSFDLIELSKIFPQDKYELINLQYGNIEEDLLKLKINEKRDIIIFNSIDYTNDIDDIAALMCSCDLIVSIESFAAILSGSLGLNTYLLSTTIPNFIWSTKSNNQSLWFPSVKIFKQTKPNSWSDVKVMLKKELIK